MFPKEPGAGFRRHSRVSNMWDLGSVELLALPLIPKIGPVPKPIALYGHVPS